LLLKWVANWESGDMETYRSCYASYFQSKGMNLNEWISHKTNVRNKSKNINIRIDDLQISAEGNSATAVFTQSYSSSILKDKGKKTLELRKINNEWKIYKEII
jgi:ketosteroid isomerase-like protein